MVQKLGNELLKVFHRGTFSSRLTSEELDSPAESQPFRGRSPALQRSTGTVPGSTGPPRLVLSTGVL